MASETGYHANKTDLDAMTAFILKISFTETPSVYDRVVSQAEFLLRRCVRISLKIPNRLNAHENLSIFDKMDLFSFDQAKDLTFTDFGK